MLRILNFKNPYLIFNIYYLIFKFYHFLLTNKNPITISKNASITISAHGGKQSASKIPAPRQITITPKTIPFQITLPTSFLRNLLLPQIHNIPRMKMCD